MLAVLDVLREAEFYPRHWRTLGRRLGVKDVDLDTIDANHVKEGVERCLEETIRQWQRDGDNTWEKLAEAVSLCEGGGGGRNVARKVQIRVGLQRGRCNKWYMLLIGRYYTSQMKHLCIIFHTKKVVTLVNFYTFFVAKNNH